MTYSNHWAQGLAVRKIPANSHFSLFRSPGGGGREGHHSEAGQGGQTVSHRGHTVTGVSSLRGRAGRARQCPACGHSRVGAL